MSIYIYISAWMAWGCFLFLGNTKFDEFVGETTFALFAFRKSKIVVYKKYRTDFFRSFWCRVETRTSFPETNMAPENNPWKPSFLGAKLLLVSGSGRQLLKGETTSFFCRYHAAVHVPGGRASRLHLLSRSSKSKHTDLAVACPEGVQFGGFGHITDLYQSGPGRHMPYLLEMVPKTAGSKDVPPPDFQDRNPAFF